MKFILKQVLLKFMVLGGCYFFLKNDGDETFVRETGIETRFWLVLVF